MSQYRDPLAGLRSQVAMKRGLVAQRGESLAPVLPPTTWLAWQIAQHPEAPARLDLDAVIAVLVGIRAAIESA